MLLDLTRPGVVGVCSVEHCTDRTRCVMSRDRTRCKCAIGFYADWCDRDANIKVTCGKDNITISVAEDFFKYYNVPLASLHLPNKSCRAHREVIDGEPSYVASISKDQYVTCAARKVETNITHIFFALTLSATRVFGNIRRDPDVKIDYTCIYPYIRTVSLQFPVKPFSSETVVRVAELDAKIQMLLYRDHTYTEAYSQAPIIQLRDRVFVEVKVTEPAEIFLLRVSECWAAQSRQPDNTGGLVHTLILNGCVDDKTVSFLSVKENQSGGNGRSSAVRYSFDMFRFTTLPYDLYLHCAVQLCEPEHDELCRPNCKSIRKREAVRADAAQGLLSYGPIRIESSEGSHSSILTMVVLPVAVIWTVGLFLILLITVAKASSRRLAQIEER
ncbi:zona pellucida glycoprotein d [Diretmus argenteus]